MKQSVRLMMVLGCVCMVALMSACATSAQTVVSTAVGPAQTRSVSTASTGKLVVYSAPTVTTVEQARYPVHTPYTLSDASGKMLQEVDNRTGFFDSSPVTLPLAAGSYFVKALAAGRGYVVVPVRIEPGKTTIVDLDGTAMPQNVTADSRYVRLPDGHIVGYRANE